MGWAKVQTTLTIYKVNDKDPKIGVMWGAILIGVGFKARSNHLLMV